MIDTIPDNFQSTPLDDGVLKFFGMSFSRGEAGKATYQPLNSQTPRDLVKPEHFARIRHTVGYTSRAAKRRNES